MTPKQRLVSRRHEYIVYNPGTLQIVRTFDRIGEAARFMDRSASSGLALINRMHPAPPVAVIARVSCADKTNGFTGDRRYALLSVELHGRQGTVLNDRGHPRVVPLDGSKTAHFIRSTSFMDSPVGGFDVEYADGTIERPWVAAR